MSSAELPDLPAGADRLPFAHASPLQQAQALVYATQQLGSRFAPLGWETWFASIQHVQPELVVQGSTVWLEWLGLARLVQHLTQAQVPDVLDSPVFCRTAAELAAHLMACEVLAAQLRAAPTARSEPGSPALDQLLALLTPHATAGRIYLATHEPTPGAPPSPPSPPVASPAAPVARPPAGRGPATGARTRPPAATPPAPTTPAVPSLPPVTKSAPDAATGPAARPGASPRRTFRDIVQHHPRANGKQGFTVRELCRAMRISATSLREAHANPGRLSLNALSALAALMQEPLPTVLADLLTSPSTRKRNRRGVVRPWPNAP